MSLVEDQNILLTDPACPSAVAALEHDPFYCSIAVEFARDDAPRRAALARYFAYSIREGTRIGRTVHLADAHLGVAVWLLPQCAELQQREAMRKRKFLRETLGPLGSSNYDRIVDYMKAHADAIVADDSWYLSIIAVVPEAQGQGLGRRLLAPTLAEADAAGAVCYLETFNPRNLTFYERFGFAIRAQFEEPTTQAECTIMVRNPISAQADSK